MNSNIISSKSGLQFHPMVGVFLLLFCIPVYSSENYLVLAILVIITAITWFLEMVIKIDVINRRYKSGLFKSWDSLSVGGYVSIFTETSGQKVQARSQSTTIRNKELRLNYIQGKVKKHIYTAKSKEEAEKVALRLGEQWDVGVFDGMERIWLKEKTA
ncbi:MAG: hypothetical protein COA58_05545 [Bacteroidetes bacterium]|nr:MAG: hypothetical protein COA58_05545 [Bacteroidota bacterium]